MDWFLLLAGLSLLFGGGEILVQGATAMARRFGVSTLVIGLTVVAMGTSAPELAVNMMAAFRGQMGLSFGNIIGSNIANTIFILGAAAMIRPLRILPSVSKRELPIMLLATLAVLVALGDPLFGGVSVISRFDGLLLLLGFLLFIYLTFRRARRDRQAFREAEESAEEAVHGREIGMVAAWLLTLGGLGAVIWGSDLTVRGATGIALAFGVSDAIIGLTIVAIGTSLPELVACLAAVRAGHSDLAVGNVVGSNIFNLLLVFGPTAMIRPIPLPAGGFTDLVVLAIASLLLLVLALAPGKRITRPQGLALLIAYWVYLIWRSFGG
ncbi:MAG: calcium/sodium antiporter [bacterium]|nr:calcium/sodium antiporter [bacterium]